MRLIDADVLMEQVKAIHRAVDASELNLDYDTGFHSATSQIQGLIETIPTAYDVDKVVEELEELGMASEALKKQGELAEAVHRIEALNPVDYGWMGSYEAHEGAKAMQRDVLDILNDLIEEEE